MKRVTKSELMEFNFHSITRHIPQVIASGMRIANNRIEQTIPLVLFEGQILFDWWRYHRALDRGWAWVEAFDAHLMGCDPITFALRASYLSPSQRALAAARLLRLIRTRPDYLASFDAQLLRPMFSHRAAEHFANIEWNVRPHSLQRARVIVENSNDPEFMRAIEEGRISLSKAADALHALADDPAEIARIARLGDTRKSNAAIDQAIARVPRDRRRRQAQVGEDHKWNLIEPNSTPESEGKTRRTLDALRRWGNGHDIEIGLNNGRRPTSEELFQIGYEWASRGLIGRSSDPDVKFDIGSKPTH